MSQQGWKQVAGLLSLVLVVIVAMLAVVLIIQPGPTPTGQPTPTPAPTPSPGPTPSPTPFPSFSIPPLPTPTPTPSVSPSGSPSPSPSPSPGISRVITLLDLGLDPPDTAQSRERVLTFGVDGPSVIRATVTGTGDTPSRTRVCLWHGDPDHVSDRRCVDLRKKGGSISRSVDVEGHEIWSLSIIGNSPTNPTPAVDLKLSFDAATPQVSLHDFRFQGHQVSDYNGFVARIDAGAGQLSLSASFSDGSGGSYPYRLIVRAAGSATALADQSGGPAPNMSFSSNIDAGEWRVELHDTNNLEAIQVFLDAVLSWP